MFGRALPMLGGRRVRRRRGRLAARPHAELAQDRRDVVVDRPRREHEPLGDLGVALPVGDQREHLDLARGQRRRVRARRGRGPRGTATPRARSAWRRLRRRAGAEALELGERLQERASSPASASARAASYGQPCARQRRGGASASPASCSRYGSAIQSGALVERARLPLPVRELAGEPEVPLLERERVDGARLLDRRSASPRATPSRRAPRGRARAAAGGRRARRSRAPRRAPPQRRGRRAARAPARARSSELISADRIDRPRQTSPRARSAATSQRPL